MDITKKFLGNFWAPFGVIIPVLIFLSDKEKLGLTDYYCTPDNSIIQYFTDMNVRGFCSLFVFVGEVFVAWLALLLIVLVLDLMLLPIRTIVRRRKNRVHVIKNPFYD